MIWSGTVHGTPCGTGVPPQLAEVIELREQLAEARHAAELAQERQRSAEALAAAHRQQIEDLRRTVRMLEAAPSTRPEPTPVPPAAPEPASTPAPHQVIPETPAPAISHPPAGSRDGSGPGSAGR